MKTVRKYSRIEKGQPPDAQSIGKKDLLVDDPASHDLLQSSNSIVSDLIKIKERKVFYNREMKLMMSGIGLCLSMLLIIGMFEWQVSDRGSTVEINASEESFENLMEIPQTEQMEPPPPQVQSPVVIEVADEEIVEEMRIELDIEITEDTKIEEVVFDNTKEVIPEEKADEIFTIVEEQPSPSGGLQAFYKYIGDNLQYPSKARRMGIEGRVFVQFVVEKDGSLTDIQAVKGIGGGCDEEAMRVISEAPKWKPGKQRGQPVRVRMVLPIMFKLVG